MNTSLTNKIGGEGGKAIGEALKVNTSLTVIYLDSNNIGDEGGKAIGEALKVNTSLTNIYLLVRIILVMKGVMKGERQSERH